MTHLGNLVKLAKQFIKHDHKLFGRTVTSQSGKANNVSIKNTERKKQKKEHISPIKQVSLLSALIKQFKMHELQKAE